MTPCDAVADGLDLLAQVPEEQRAYQEADIHRILIDELVARNRGRIDASENPDPGM